MVPESKFHFLAGTAKHYTSKHESGINITVHFCGDCGSPIYKTGDQNFEGTAIVQVGTLDDPESLKQVRPQEELYSKYRALWLPSLEGAVQKEGF